MSLTANLREFSDEELLTEFALAWYNADQGALEELASIVMDRQAIDIDFDEIG